MARHTNGSIVPFLTPYTCSDRSCNGSCGRSHDIPPAVTSAYGDQGDDAA